MILLPTLASANAIWFLTGGMPELHRQGPVTHAQSPDGSLYLAGQFNHDTLYIADSLIFKAGTNSNGFIAKYNTEGSAEWVNTIRSNFLGEPFSHFSLTHGHQNDVFYEHRRITYFIVNGDTVLNNEHFGHLIAKFSSEGNYSWGRLIHDASVSFLTTTDNNHMYVIGIYGGMGNTLSIDHLSVSFDDEIDNLGIYILELDAMGSAVSLENIATLNLNENCETGSIHLNALLPLPNGGWFLLGEMLNFTADFNGQSFSNCGKADLNDRESFYVFLDDDWNATSSALWDHHSPFINDASIGSSGIYLTGSVRGENITVAPDITFEHDQAFIMALDFAGNTKWVSQIEDEKSKSGLEVVPYGNVVYLAGHKNHYTRFLGFNSPIEGIYFAVFDKNSGKEKFYYPERRFFPKVGSLTVGPDGYPYMSGTSNEGVVFGNLPEVPVAHGSDFFITRLCNFNMFFGFDIEADGSTTFPEGESVTLSVPENERLSYRWYREGSPISSNDNPGATSHEITLDRAGDYFLEMQDKEYPTLCRFNSEIVTINIGQNYLTKPDDEYPIQVYPNPTRESITFVFPSVQGTLTIRDVSGRTLKQVSINGVKSQTFTTQELNINQPGVWLAEWRSNEGIFYKKIIVEQ